MGRRRLKSDQIPFFPKSKAPATYPSASLNGISPLKLMLLRSPDRTVPTHTVLMEEHKSTNDDDKSP